MRKYKLGCDPELFLIDTSGVLRASCGKIGGTKTKPLPLPIGDGYAVQEDNVAVEFNIPPAETAREFRQSISSTLHLLTARLGQQYGYTLSKESAASFPDEELESPQALEFGCDPDFNAWTGKVNPKPKADDPNLRSCGGHIHVGIDLQKTEDKRRFIKLMDLYIGVPSVLMDRGEKRKLLYGKAGAYRPQLYKGDIHGVEYRTPSNFWIFDERLVTWVWDNTARAAEAVDSQFAIDEYKDSILQAINNNDKDMARFLVQQHNLEVVNA